MDQAEILANMSLEEKASYVSGAGLWHSKALPRLGIPARYMTDGPNGVRSQTDADKGTDYRKNIPTTVFPAACLSACSFDPDLVEEMGRALARECLKHEVVLLLGPGANIKRSPLCGRNFEYFSEDPLVSASIAAAWIRGLEALGVGASLKHYAVNNQEKRRMLIDAVVEPRALREIYLASFEEAVIAGKPSSVMCAYNYVNGESCSESDFLTNRVLRGEWGYRGFVVTDWGASNDRVIGLKAGIDLEMPETVPGKDAEIVAAVKTGELSEAVLDTSVSRLLSFFLRSKPAPGTGTWTAEDHHELARRIARESMVLLKNEGDILPLAKEGPLGLIGELAASPRYQGAGSAFLSPTRLESLRDALFSRGVAFDYAAGYRIDTDLPEAALEAEAVEVARRIAAAGGRLLLVIGLTDINEGEGFDRSHLSLPVNQTRLIEKLAPICHDIVAVFVGGSPVETPWIDKVRALLAGYLGGQALGAAQYDLLFGDHSPSGKLAETWPLALEDNPSWGNFPGDERKVLYKEGLFVGYRWYASAGRAVRFPFGHGLGYTRFDYSDAALSAASMGPEDEVALSFTLTNGGSRSGAEVAQIYVSFPDSAVERPLLSLAAFVKTRLEPGEARRFEIVLGRRALRYWDVSTGSFKVESGRVLIRVGGSSADLPLEVELTIAGGTRPRENFPRRTTLRHPSEMSDADFEARLGFKIGAPPSLKPYHLGSTFGEMKRDSFLVGLVYSFLVKEYNKSSGVKKGQSNYRMMEEMIGDMPIGKISGASNGRFTLGMAQGICDLANGKKIEGIMRMLGRKT